MNRAAILRKDTTSCYILVFTRMNRLEYEILAPTCNNRIALALIINHQIKLEFIKNEYF
jgi:hypothetical protein